ncbi:MAG: FapA family protein [Spirochaetaceae bacterium]|jgi:uncharacterized protein (DUF342 family)|nr:FapA family protein [Spirochaetaceae bacterium]
MVDFARLQAVVKERLEEDLSIQAVDAEGATLEAAISEAATLLDIPIRNIEYEIVDKTTAFLGVGRNFCKIRAYERLDIKNKKIEEAAAAEELLSAEEEIVIIEDKDGEVFVQARHNGLYLKITPPVGAGKKVNVNQALAVLQNKGATEIDKATVTKSINSASGEYEKAAEYKHIALNDSSVDVEIAEQEMKAYITVTPSGTGGADLRYEDYMNQLSNNQVIYGIDEEFLKNFADKPKYHEKICVATGKKAVDGMNSYVEYYFEVDQNKVRLKEDSDGKINFKELNIIQNVFEGEKLAKVVSAARGDMGFTVTGKSIPAKDGKEIAVLLGKNVHFADDNVTILADINGQVVMANSKINVESILTVNGSVNLKTGNIIFLGNVVVTGNVEEGFSVKAAGNIEIYGSVDKAALDAEGDIIVRQGIAGKEKIKVTSARSIWAKFIENANVYAENMVVVSDGIINSNVDAGKRIICQGKRAAVIGGRLRATEEISAKSLGSPSGNTETICEVGIEPKCKAELENCSKKQAELETELSDVQLNYQTLLAIQHQRGELPADKEEYFKELSEKRGMLSKDIAELCDRSEQLKKQLSELDVVGRVSASVKVHSGVVIVIHEVKEIVRKEYKAVTFMLENDLIRADKFVETEANTSKSG